jgi:hypothetical protein
MQLEDLHEEHLNSLPPEMHMDYLLTSSVYLQKNDLNGWLQKFKPCLNKTTPCNPLKRKRGITVAPTQEQKCEECHQEVIEDIREGHVVCLTCGLIQKSPIYQPDSKVLFFLSLFFGFLILIFFAQ